MLLELLYWLCLAVALYPYLGYPAIAFLMARLRVRSDRSGTIDVQPVSVVVAAHNEAQRIGRRVAELAPVFMDLLRQALDLVSRTKRSADWRRRAEGVLARAEGRRA